MSPNLMKFKSDKRIAMSKKISEWLLVALGIMLAAGGLMAEPVAIGLVIADITFDKPLPLQSNEEAVLSVTVKNTGPADSAPDLLVLSLEEGNIRLPGYRRLYKEFPLASLPPAGQAMLKFVYLPQNTRALSAKVELYLESAPQVNKTMTFQLLAPKAPDFRIDAIELLPGKEFYGTGEKITIKPVWSADQGRLTPFDLKFYVDGREVQDTSYYVYLPVTRNRSDALDYVFTQPGTHTVKVVLNQGSLTNEQDQTNNSKEIKVIVKSILPDLVMEKLELAKTPPVAGEANKIKFTVKNAGLGASGPCLLELIAVEDSKETARQYADIPKLASNETFSNEAAYTFKPQTKKARIVATVNCGKTVTELTRENNDVFVRYAVETPVCTIPIMNDQEMKENTAAIEALLESLKTAETAKNVDNYLAVYSTECVVINPGVKDYDWQEYRYVISDIFRQYDDLQRVYKTDLPICFNGKEAATVVYTYKLEGTFREQKLRDVVSQAVLQLTLRKEGNAWKIFRQEVAKNSLTK